MSSEERKPLGVYGPFVRLTERTWVRASAIIVIREHAAPNSGPASEVLVRSGAVGTTSTAGGAYAVWTDHPAKEIMSAILDCEPGDDA